MSREKLPYSAEEREVMYQVLKEFKDLGRGELPSPQADWDLIWAFSGSHGFQEGRKVRKGVRGEFVDIGNEINESTGRMQSATRLARRITALRIDREVGEIEIGDIRKHGPYIFYNEWDWQNDDLRLTFWQGNGEDRFSFPKEKLIIPENAGNIHTGHQFEAFPEAVLGYCRDGKLVLLSDLYHLPRVMRYSWKSFPPQVVERMVFYPSTPLFGSVGLFLGEIKKVIGYGRRGDLAWYPPEDSL